MQGPERVKTNYGKLKPFFDAFVGSAGGLEELEDPYNLGFNTVGLWGRMRHPNYLGEQGIWISLYIMTIGAGVAVNGIFHWSIIGPLFLILLFSGSSTLAESISSSKYPLYQDYIGQVYKYIPLHRYKVEKSEE